VADSLTVVHVYPDLLGTYGDRGNALALVHRARARGLAGRVLEVGLDEPLPTCGDVYVVGGGEDSAQVLAARALFADDGAVSVLAGAPTLAVCAGLQLLARSFLDADGRPRTGLGLLDVDCDRLAGRAVGEILTEPVGLPGVPALSGYENHRGGARLGPDAAPLGRLVAGVGNGDGVTEGARQGTVLATYLHGPVLVRNPALADLLLTRAVGDLPPYDDEAVARLRAERLASVRAGALRRPGRARRAVVSRCRALLSGTS
jgi:CobQ-like glutamine amidotransferase family enzyme